MNKQHREEVAEKEGYCQAKLLKKFEHLKFFDLDKEVLYDVHHV